MPGFLIDLDGTMYAGSRPIEYAADFIGYLNRHRMPYLYVTNNSSRRPEEVARHLETVASVKASADEVFTSSQAAALYIADLSPGATVWPIGEDGLRHALAEAGLRVSSDEAKERPDYVVQGIDRRFTYGKLELALRHILAGARYVLTNPDRQLPAEDGPTPGAGSIAAAIRTAAGVEPVVIGKPSPIIMNFAVGRLGLPREDIWVVGDNLRTDIGGGRAAGCRTALVLTGLATRDNADTLVAETGIVPDVICGSLMELAGLL